jgi:hypothetical protein
MERSVDEARTTSAGEYAFFALAPGDYAARRRCAASIEQAVTVPAAEVRVDPAPASTHPDDGARSATRSPSVRRARRR